MDWDDLVAKVAGTEGAPRYIRIGAFLLALSFISFLALLFMPLYSAGDQSYSYFDLQEDIQGMPFGISNEHVIGHVNLAMAGCILTEIMALVLILEGKRVINLRRFLVWHAEARATSLYALSAAMATVALAGAASLWGLVSSIPTATMNGIVAEVEVGSSGTVVALVMMGICVLAMLFMTYYNSVLSVYRGGVTPRTRNMARITMLLALVSIAGIILLRLGSISIATFTVNDASGDLIEIDVFFTSARIGFYGESPDDYPVMATLNYYLGAIQVLLGMTFLAALAGAIGVSAHSLGGKSQRVRRTASLPALAIFLLASASFYGMGAAAIASAAVRELWPIDTIPVNLGWGLILAMVLILVGVILTILYFMKAGSEFVVGSFAFWKEREEPEEDVIPSEGVEVFGPAKGKEAPIDVEVARPSAPPKKPILPKKIMVLLAILVIAILLAAVLGVTMLKDITGGNGDHGPTPVEPQELPPFTLDYMETGYLDERDTLTIGVKSSVFGPDMDEIVYFVKSVEVSVQWSDEPDTSILWTNQPDTFHLEVYESWWNVGTPGSNTGPNPQGGQGSISAGWNTGGPWLAWGNESLVDTGDADVLSLGSVFVEVTMNDAGDQTTRLGRTQTDPGNDCVITITVEGTYFSITEEGQ